MRIALLSDIHDNVWMLAIALRNLQDADAMICCGDLCSPFIVSQLADGFQDRPIHIVFGNNDGDLFRITQNAHRYAHLHVHGTFFEGQLDGKRFAVNHYPDIALAVAGSGRYDVVCYGHNHAYKIERQNEVLTINPGTLMGYDPMNKKDVPSTFVIYDTATNEALGYQIATAAQRLPADATIRPYA